jgi:hypothetical protein
MSALVGSFALYGVETGIRLIIFTIPVAFVARWCDVPPGWKLAAFMTFCVIWNDCVFGRKKDSAKPDDPSTIHNRKAAGAVMTPAQVTIEARKLVHGARFQAQGAGTPEQRTP